MDENRTMLLLVLAIIIIGAAILYLLDSGAAGAGADENQTEFNKGNKINKETFLALLAEKEPVYIVMDGRNVSDEYTKRNIFQCGTDFAGSIGLVGREVVIIGMDDDGCALAFQSGALNRTTTNTECIKKLNDGDGIALYSHAGNETQYYTRAAMVGVGPLYVLGSCSVG